jgi:hypothetical protein
MWQFVTKAFGKKKTPERYFPKSRQLGQEGGA